MSNPIPFLLSTFASNEYRSQSTALVAGLLTYIMMTRVGTSNPTNFIARFKKRFRVLARLSNIAFSVGVAVAVFLVHQMYRVRWRQMLNSVGGDTLASYGAMEGTGLDSGSFGAQALSGVADNYMGFTN